MKTMQKKLSPGEYRTIKAELTAHLRKKGVSTPEADDIISAQTKEIDMMKGWQVDWGYTSDSSMKMMGH